MSGHDNSQGTTSGQAESVVTSSENGVVQRKDETGGKRRISTERLSLISLQIQLGILSLKNLAVVAEVSPHTIARWDIPGFKPGTKRKVFRVEDIRSFFEKAGDLPPAKKRRRRKVDQK